MRKYQTILTITFLVAFYWLNAQEKIVVDLSYTRLTSGLNQPEFEGGRSDFALADMNMDGHVDILSIGDHGCPGIGSDQEGIMIWFGDGEGNFTLHKGGDFGYGGVCAGDVNNDGHQDIAYGMHHNYSASDFGDQLIEVALGDGTGLNWNPWDDGLATAGEEWGMFGTDLGDINNDGWLDLVSISFGCCSGIQVYLNQGDGSWQHVYGFTGGNSDMIVKFADLNNDGYIDFVASHDNGLAYFGDGTGNFVKNDSGLPLTDGWILTGVSTADVNNDGAADVAFVNMEEGLDVYTWNKEALSWTSFSGNLPETGDYQLTQLADMNSDGYADLLAYGNRLLQVWLGNGQGNWTLATNFQTTGQMGNARALQTGGDLTHNGMPDIVLLTEEGTWLSSKNILYVFAENSPAENLWIIANYPSGGENFYPGSVRNIRWASQVPASSPSTVDLYYSIQGASGPWVTIATSIPNNGLHQWIVPDVDSDLCFLKLAVHQDNENASFITSAPFSILGSVSVAQQQYVRSQREAISPNPAVDWITIDKTVGAERMIISSLQGKTMLDVKLATDRVNIVSLHPGLYVYQLMTKQLGLMNGRLIKL
jgi:hypothetical protein